MWIKNNILSMLMTEKYASYLQWFFACFNNNLCEIINFKEKN